MHSHATTSSGGCILNMVESADKHIMRWRLSLWEACLLSQTMTTENMAPGLNKHGLLLAYEAICDRPAWE